MLCFKLISTMLWCCSFSSADKQWWYGLWRGVDPLDGGLVTISITKSDENGVNIRVSDTYIRTCTDNPDLLPSGWVGSGPDFSKRGVFLADATIPDDGMDLVAPKSGLKNVPIEVYCFASPEDLDQVPEDATGIEVASELHWSFHREEEYIVVSGSLFSGEQALQSLGRGSTKGGDISLRLHRHSVRVLPTQWNGMYEGVDPLDGGLMIMSITNGDDSGKFKNIRISDTYSRSCTALPSSYLPIGWEGAGPDYSKRVISLSDAYDGGSVLLSEYDSKEIPVQVFCFAGVDDTPQPGVEYITSIEWTFDIEQGYLVVTGDLFNGQPNLISSTGSRSLGGDITMRLHKVSHEYDQSSGEEVTAIEEEVSAAFTASTTLISVAMTFLLFIFTSR